MQLVQGQLGVTRAHCQVNFLALQADHYRDIVAQQPSGPSRLSRHLDGLESSVRALGALSHCLAFLKVTVIPTFKTHESRPSQR